MNPLVSSPDSTATASHVVGQVAEAIIAARGWRQRGMAFAAGTISTLAFAPFFCWPVLFVTFPVLVWLIEGAELDPHPVRAAAIASWWFGFGYFFAGLLWVGEAFLVEAEIFAWLLPFAVTMLPAAMALYWALGGALAQWLVQSIGSNRGPGGEPPGLPFPSSARQSVARCLLLAVTLAGAEYLRGHFFTGFPWDPPGVALTYPLALMQAASVLGIYGLTLWAVFICALPLVVIAAAPTTHLRRAMLCALVLSGGPLALAYGLGAWHLSAPRSPSLPGVKLRIVQPSVPQRDKWIGARQAAIFADHLDLSRRDAAGRVDHLAGVTHLVWPEASMPFGPLDHPEALAAIGQLLPAGAHLLAGALRAETGEADGPRKAFNSLMVFGAGGLLIGLYDKVHLVPFGEYLPFQATLEAIGLQSLTRQRGGFSSGVLPKPELHVPGLPPVGPLICYEAIFPSEAAAMGERQGLLVVVTNDGWFGNTTGPQQHFHQTRLRAVEQGLSVVRAANNGISAVIDPEGRVLASLALNARGSIDSALPAARPPTVYARWGDGVFLFNGLGFLLAAWFLARPGRTTV